jgi:hypothetical protein
LSSCSCSCRHSAELLRESLLPEDHFLHRRSDILRQIPVDKTSSDLLPRLDQIDYTRDYITIHSITSDFMSGASAHSVSNSTVFEGLDEGFPVPSGASEAIRDRFWKDKIRLAIDLAMSRTVLASEDPPALSPLSAQITRPSTPDELFARAASLTLNEREAPPVSFSILHPRSLYRPPMRSEVMFDEEVQNVDEDIEGNPMKAIDMPSVRTILSEWTLGSDPREYTWTAWRDTLQSGIGTPTKRPIRPLPSPRTAPFRRSFPSQPTLPSRGMFASQYPPSLAQTHVPKFNPFPTPITALGPTESVPALQEGEYARSSSPPIPEMGQHPSTQMERGVFGGRLEVGLRTKKKARKRQGGF